MVALEVLVEDAGCVAHLGCVRPGVLMLTRIATIAAASGLAAGLLPLVQASKIVRTRNAAGISLVYLAGGVLNSTVWTTYSFCVRNLTLIVPNVVTLATMSALLAIAIACRFGERAAGRKRSAGVPSELPMRKPRSSPTGARSVAIDEADTLVLARLDRDADTLVLARP